MLSRAVLLASMLALGTIASIGHAGVHPAVPAAGAPVAPVRVSRALAPETEFVLPLPPPPVVLRGFAPGPNPFGAGHRGVDLAAPAGSVIRAAGNGRVVYAADLAGRGVVSVEHVGGLRTTYEPVAASVAPGAAVVAGQPIGVLERGHVACAPADCLHWGARLADRVYLDPLALLTTWQVRLWPWDEG